MAFSDEQRPEAQLGNQNRSSLNIKQPGENYWQDFFNNPENAVDHSTSFSLGDVLPTMGKGFAQSVRGTGEMARGLGDALVNNPVKTLAGLSSFMTDVYMPPSSTQKELGAPPSVGDAIKNIPDGTGKNAVTDTVGKGLKATGKAVSDGAKASDEWLTDQMSPGAVRALNTPMSEGYDDSAVLLTKGVNLIGALVPDLVAGGVTKKLGEVTLRKV
ncbi:hypothetical protein EJK73_004891, partial [Escherichia coli]|nr:hypothetical protein [Escherichia coli]